jgi:glycine C-acetyltransferase
MVNSFKEHINAELARIRVQISAAHTPEQIEFAVDKFIKVGKKLIC